MCESMSPGRIIWFAAAITFACGGAEIGVVEVLVIIPFSMRRCRGVKLPPGAVAVDDECHCQQRPLATRVVVVGGLVGGGGRRGREDIPFCVSRWEGGVEVMLVARYIV